MGSSGLSFSKRFVDCNAATFRYVVSDAATIEEATKGKMGPLPDRSVSYILGYAACTSPYSATPPTRRWPADALDQVTRAGSRDGRVSQSDRAMT